MALPANLKLSLALSLAALSLTSVAKAVDVAGAPSSDQLLKDSDRSRGAIGDGIAWDIDVHTYEDDSQNEVHYAVRAKGVDALAEATAPPRNKGENMLFNDRNLWFFKPGIKKPVAISARQKLMGQAANGDIASTNYYRDYEGHVVGEDKVDGVDTWRLELKAKAKNVTYDGIRYWITKADHLGVKSEFLTVSGEMFKRATIAYKNHITVDGKPLPFVSQMDIVSALNAANHTVISYSVPHFEKIADSTFNVNNLVR